MRSGQEKGKNFFGCRYVVDIDLVRDEKKSVVVKGSHLGSALQLAPTLLKTTTGHVTGTISHGSSAGIGSRAGSRVLATQAGIAAVVAVYGVTGTTTSDVVDGGSAA